MGLSARDGRLNARDAGCMDLGSKANGIPAVDSGIPGPGIGCPERCSHFYFWPKDTTFWDFPLCGGKESGHRPEGSAGSVPKSVQTGKMITWEPRVGWGTAMIYVVQNLVPGICAVLGSVPSTIHTSEIALQPVGWYKAERSGWRDGFSCSEHLLFF